MVRRTREGLGSDWWYQVQTLAGNFLWLAFALSLFATPARAATTQPWTSGWDNFSEPLNFSQSSVTWAVSSSGQLTITFKLVGAKRTKLYQVGIHVMDCSTTPATFGRFPFTGGTTCGAITRQGVTDTVNAVEMGVILTDSHGNGSFTVNVGTPTAGTYALEFDVRDGAGCNVTGGAGHGSDCNLDFQSPGPVFGDETTITIP